MKQRTYTVIIILFIILNAIIVMPISATSETFSPDADLYVDQTAPDDHHDDVKDYFYVMSREKDGTLRNRRALIHFDLSSIPLGATIDSATLRLRIWKVTANRTHNVHRVTASWTETGATWNSRDTGIPWTTAGGDYDSTVTDSTSTGTTADVWLEWDVKTDVQAFVSGTSPNYGWLIKDAVEDESPYKYAKYYSREYTDDPNKRPKLEVTYTEAGPTPTPTPTPTPGPGPVAAPEFSPLGLVALIGVLSLLLAVTTIGKRKRRE